MNGNVCARETALAVRDAFEAYHEQFRAITRRARRRFEQRDWPGVQHDAGERLGCYARHLHAVLGRLQQGLAGRVADVGLWTEAKRLHADLVAERDDRELAETFFNSATRRICATVGVDARVEYVVPESRADLDEVRDPPAYRSFPRGRDTAELVERVLRGVPWRAPWADREGDAAAVAARVDAAVRSAWGGEGFDGVEMLPCPFFRNKGAYLVGRVYRGDRFLPLLLALLNGPAGIEVDAVLTTPDEASIVFGFSWSYFLADVECPRAAVRFLASLMPLKRVDELYNAMGFTRHGKTELYRTLVRHLRQPGARFEIASGDPGLVMSVFTLPSLNVVFKVIRDAIGQPKRTTRREVMDHYRLVFAHDRVGRLADAQEFEYLQFPRACFPDALLCELLESAGSVVRVEGDQVVVRHLYTERRVTPLNLYLRDATPDGAREAILDYGQAIHDLAAANIFTGDMLLKNFGVSRHGRVIFYDYDELCLLSDCTVRRLPEPADTDEELAAEPWFGVGEHDIFPEEFAAFLVPGGALGEAFLARHRELLTVDFWREMQDRHRRGEMTDVFPYRDECRLHRR